MVHSGSCRAVLCAVFCTLTLSASVARAQMFSAIAVKSQPGDGLSNGSDTTFVGTTSIGYAGDFEVVGVAGGEWAVAFGASTGLPIQVGVYENASSGTGNSRSLALPYLAVRSPEHCGGLGDVKVFGRFQVYELATDGLGHITRFAADFEAHCPNTAAAIVGAVRYQSTRTSLDPFDGGAAPVYSMHLESSTRGFVTAPGLDCGAGRTDCDETYTPDATITMHASASPGYVFVGWAGDCKGQANIDVRIVRRRYCAPIFSAVQGSGGSNPPEYADATIVLDGVVPTGEGTSGTHIRQVYLTQPIGSLVRSMVAPYLGSRSPSSVQIDGEGPGLSSTSLRFTAPAGSNLTPGTYDTSAAGNSATIHVYPMSEACDLGARFVVHEYSFDTGSSTVAAFSADFEMHCPDGLLRGAVRYHAQRTSLVPLDGADPLYTLKALASVGGYVTAPGIDCGVGGRTDCDETYASPATVTLQAVAASGYDFLGWADQCTGLDTTVQVTVDRIVRCAPVFAPLTAGAAADAYNGNAALLFQDLSGSPPRQVWFTLKGFSGDELFASFSVPQLQMTFSGARRPLAPGTFEQEYLLRSFVELPQLGLGLCRSNVSRFRIYEYDRDATGLIVRFAADFEVLCESGAHVVGAVRWRSTRGQLLPFDGAYPLYKLTIEPAVNGTVVGAGIDCGPGRTACVATATTPFMATLQAVPQPGYRFVGWTGECVGAAVTTVNVPWLRHCSAVFNAAIPGMGVEDSRRRARALVIDSQPGDVPGNGRRNIVGDSDAFMPNITATMVSRAAALITVPQPDYLTWWIYLKSPDGRDLVPGTYENAIDAFLSSSTRPGLHVASTYGVCPSMEAVGRFVLYEIAFAAPGSSTVTSLAADFEQRCSGTAPLLRGSIRFNSSRPILTPFAPSLPVAQPLRPDVNHDGWPDLIWRHPASGYNAIWLMSGPNVNTTTLLAPAAAEWLPDPDWEIRAIGDLNGDTNADLIWQNRATGQLAVWFMSGTARIGTNFIYTATGDSNVEPDLDWKIVAAGDMDRDGQVDLLWRHRTSGALRVWHMNGIQQWDSVPFATVTDTAWEIGGVADVNRDGFLDLVWRHAGTGMLAVWYMSDTVMQETRWLSPDTFADPAWRLVGVADMNIDGRPDLVWQNYTTGELGVWFMDGPARIGGQYLNPSRVSDPAWRIVGVR